MYCVPFFIMGHPVKDPAQFKDYENVDGIGVQSHI
jgi:hypothetical protein